MRKAIKAFLIIFSFLALGAALLPVYTVDNGEIAALGDYRWTVTEDTTVRISNWFGINLCQSIDVEKGSIVETDWTGFEIQSIKRPK